MGASGAGAKGTPSTKTTYHKAFLRPSGWSLEQGKTEPVEAVWESSSCLPCSLRTHPPSKSCCPISFPVPLATGFSGGPSGVPGGLTPSLGSGSLSVCLNGFCKGNPCLFPKSLHLSPAATSGPVPKSLSLICPAATSFLFTLGLERHPSSPQAEGRDRFLSSHRMGGGGSATGRQGVQDILL